MATMPNFANMANEELFGLMPDPGDNNPQAGDWRTAHRQEMTNRILDKRIPILQLQTILEKAFKKARFNFSNWIKLRGECRGLAIDIRYLERLGASSSRVPWYDLDELDKEFHRERETLNKIVKKTMTAKDLLQFQPVVFARSTAEAIQFIHALEVYYYNWWKEKAESLRQEREDKRKAIRGARSFLYGS